MDQLLETIHLDHESEHKITHCLVILSHCNEFFNIIKVEPCAFVQSLNEDLLGLCYLLGIVLGDGNTEMSKHWELSQRGFNSHCRVEDLAMTQARQLEVECTGMLSW